MRNSDGFALTGRLVFPVESPPLAGGTVVVAGERIVAVAPAARRRADVDLGNVAILPGLVNTHTHLDLSGLRGKCPPQADFTKWLRQVIAHRRSQTPEQQSDDISAGLAECLATGTTLVGDIASMGSSRPALSTAPLRSTVFFELLGIGDEAIANMCKEVVAWLAKCPPGAGCRAGLSPHAPYSTNAALYQAAADLAAERNLPLATHLAETTDELQFLADGTGPFLAFLKELGVWRGGIWHERPQDYVKRFGLFARHFLLVHCNFLPVDTPIPSEGTIVYCPRTHAAFGHAPHPFREFLRRGVRVALGTDSLASNPDLDLLAEMRFIHDLYPDFPGDALLRMGTLSGAEALGWAEETGSLTAGKSADLVVVPLPDADGEPHRLLFDARSPVARTMFRGAWR
jgi:aminodeoxyfutalosine deaminase